MRSNYKYWISAFSVLVLVACDKNIVDIAKKEIESTLIDPSSVQYRNIVAYSEDAVCGEFNAKNRMGGYVGFKPFVYQNKQVALDAEWEIRSLWCNNESDKNLKSIKKELQKQEAGCIREKEDTNWQCAQVDKLSNELKEAEGKSKASVKR